MISTGIRQRRGRQGRREAATHLFIVGQAVRLRGGFGSPAEIYRITATLPQRGDSLQYRIRNDEERHERVTTQDNLERVSLAHSADGATLLERTFGNGQRAKTQQSRNQEAEAE